MRWLEENGTSSTGASLYYDLPELTYAGTAKRTGEAKKEADTSTTGLDVFESTEPTQHIAEPNDGDALSRAAWNALTQCEDNA